MIINSHDFNVAQAMKQREKKYKKFKKKLKENLSQWSLKAREASYKARGIKPDDKTKGNAS